MQNDWTDILREIVAADGRSMRQISAACGFGPNYLSQAIQQGRKPSFDKLAKLAEVLGVSSARLATGADVSPEAEEMLGLLGTLTADQRQLLLRLARDLQAAAPNQEK